MGDLTGARTLQEQVVGGAPRRVLGDEHPATLSALNNLASTLQTLGDLHGARQIQTQVVEQSRLVLGEEHPATLTALNNLALTLAALGDNRGACEPLPRRWPRRVVGSWVKRTRTR